tara:strand:+ start:39866 stop:40837 length:972 start_codon:yes stop_codon:yes gene_type:complete
MIPRCRQKNFFTFIASRPELHAMFDCRVHGKPVPTDIVGVFRDSTDVMADSAALQARMCDDGYVFLRGVVGPSSIAMARHEVFGRLADVGEIAEPPVEGIFTGQSQRPAKPSERGAFWQSVSEGPALRRVTHGPEMHYVLDTLFGEPSRGYNFIFLRPGVPGRFTFLHYDLPFFSRGTKNVVTAWTAIGDIPTTEGPLFVLENSHRFDDLIKPIQTIDYNSKDSPQVQMMDDAVEFARSRGSRLLTANFEPGDVILFGMTTMHGSFDNCSPINRTRLSVDVRWQPASEPIDERYFGANPAGTTGIGYAELNGAKPLTEPWHTR